MSSRTRTILIVIAAGALLAGLLALGLGVLTAPPPVTSVSLDAERVASADPAVRWLDTRTPATITALPPLATVERIALPGELAIAARLGGLWGQVRDRESALLALHPLPLAAGSAARDIGPQLKELATAYHDNAEGRAQLGWYLYQHAWDDYWPSYHHAQVFAPLERETLALALDAPSRDYLSLPYRRATTEVARQHHLRAMAAQTRWEATDTLFNAELKAALAAYDAAWDSELRLRLGTLAGSLTTSESEYRRTASPLLGPAVPTGASPIRDQYNALIAAHAQRIETPAPTGPELPSNEAAADRLRADWRSISADRLAASLMGEGWSLTEEAATDVSEALTTLLYPSLTEEAPATP